MKLDPDRFDWHDALRAVNTLMLLIASAAMLGGSISGTLFDGGGVYWYAVCVTSWCFSAPREPHRGSHAVPPDGWEVDP